VATVVRLRISFTISFELSCALAVSIRQTIMSRGTIALTFPMVAAIYRFVFRIRALARSFIRKSHQFGRSNRERTVLERRRSRARFAIIPM
jgi:hypothetical protein